MSVVFSLEEVLGCRDTKDERGAAHVSLGTRPFVGRRGRTIAIRANSGASLLVP